MATTYASDEAELRRRNDRSPHSHIEIWWYAPQVEQQLMLIESPDHRGLSRAQRGCKAGVEGDGPLAFDNAIDPEAVKIKGIKSPVAGRAQILIVPDLEAGNMLAKNLTFLAKADAAGIVLGARVPVILTSRADSVRSRRASAAVAVLYADARRQKATVAAV